MEKHSVSRLCYLFAHLHLLSSDSFSSLIFSLLLFSSLPLPILGCMVALAKSSQIMLLCIIPFLAIRRLYGVFGPYQPPKAIIGKALCWRVCQNTEEHPVLSTVYFTTLPSWSIMIYHDHHLWVPSWRQGKSIQYAGESKDENWLYQTNNAVQCLSMPGTRSANFVWKLLGLHGTALMKHFASAMSRTCSWHYDTLLYASLHNICETPSLSMFQVYRVCMSKSLDWSGGILINMLFQNMHSLLCSVHFSKAKGITLGCQDVSRLRCTVHLEVVPTYYLNDF